MDSDFYWDYICIVHIASREIILYSLVWEEIKDSGYGSKVAACKNNHAIKLN